MTNLMKKAVFVFVGGISSVMAGNNTDKEFPNGRPFSRLSPEEIDVLAMINLDFSWCDDQRTD
jgi:hypothetical protein